MPTSSPLRGRRTEEGRTSARTRAGSVPVRDLLDTEFPVLPRVGGDNGVLLWGFRRDEKKGLPTARLRAEAGARPRPQERGGRPGPTREEVATAYDELAAKWYASATDEHPGAAHLPPGRGAHHGAPARRSSGTRREAIGPGVKRASAPRPGPSWSAATRRTASGARTAWARKRGRPRGGTCCSGCAPGPWWHRAHYCPRRARRVLGRQGEAPARVPGEKAMRIELAKAPPRAGRSPRLAGQRAAVVDTGDPPRGRPGHPRHDRGRAGGRVRAALPDRARRRTGRSRTRERICSFDEADRLFGHLLAAFLTDRAGGVGAAR